MYLSFIYMHEYDYMYSNYLVTDSSTTLPALHDELAY